jgi:hypothetical protein
MCGLSNQWKTRDGLLDRFVGDSTDEKYCLIRRLLELLDAHAKPMIYVGTSHSLMNFSNRDVVRADDRTEPFAYVDVVRLPPPATGCFYRVETRRLQGLRPTSEWLQQDLTTAEAVVELLIEAFAYADIPPRKCQ